MNRHARRADKKKNKNRVGYLKSIAKEISKEEFDAYGIERHLPAAPFQEKRWFSCKGLLGVITFDHDGEWNWVVLAKHVERGYAAIDHAVSYRTCAEAIEGMFSSFVKNEVVDLNTLTGGPLTKEEAIATVARRTGMSEDLVRAGVEDFLHNPRARNN